MKNKLVKIVCILSKGKMSLEHIDDEVSRHISILKHSSIFFAALLFLLLSFFWAARDALYLDIAFFSAFAFVAASFLPDVLTFAVFSVKPKSAHKCYRITHSNKGLAIFSLANFLFFLLIVSFQKSLFITFFGLLGYSMHLLVDVFERFEEICAFAIRNFFDRNFPLHNLRFSMYPQRIVLSKHADSFLLWRAMKRGFSMSWKTKTANEIMHHRDELAKQRTNAECL